LIENAVDYDTTDKSINNVTPGSIIVGDYSFDVLESTIPVYFRVQAADLVTEDAVTGDPVDIEYEQMVRVILTGHLLDPDAFIAASQPFIEPVPFRTPPFEATLQLGPGNFYYCDLPLSPFYAWEVQVNHDIYLYGAYNGNDIQNSKIYFTNLDGDDELIVDIIQATNNAVYLADDWTGVAGEPYPLGPDFFVEYISDAYGMYQFMLDNVYK
jgi:hypothetical protein